MMYRGQGFEEVVAVARKYIFQERKYQYAARISLDTTSRFRLESTFFLSTFIRGKRKTNPLSVPDGVRRKAHGLTAPIHHTDFRSSMSVLAHELFVDQKDRGLYYRYARTLTPRVEVLCTPTIVT